MSATTKRPTHVFTNHDEEGIDGSRLRMRFVTDLTPDEIARIPLAPGTSYDAIMDVIAPYITGWNVTRNGEIQDPPSVAGPAAFRDLTPAQFVWCYQALLGGVTVAKLMKPRDFGASIAFLQQQFARL